MACLQNCSYSRFRIRMRMRINDANAWISKHERGSSIDARPSSDEQVENRFEDEPNVEVSRGSLPFPRSWPV